MKQKLEDESVNQHESKHVGMMTKSLRERGVEAIKPCPTTGEAWIPLHRTQVWNINTFARWEQK
jgi:hypothetical protein